MKKKIEIIDGFSKSAWKSLAVKALRIGWVAGLERAEAAIGKSDMRSVLTCGVFEDIFPAVNEIQATMSEVMQRNYSALCARQTHHGRPGITERFCQLEPRAVHAAEHQYKRLWAFAKERNIWIPIRALNCWWTWLHIAPTDSGVRRSIDNSPWLGMPIEMIDSHTREGKARGVNTTLLSGHYHKHLELSQIVQAHGWEYVRNIVHSRTPEPEQRTLQTGDLFSNI